MVGRASGCFPDVRRDIFLKPCCRKTNYHMKGHECQESEGEWHALTVFNTFLFLFLYLIKKCSILSIQWLLNRHAFVCRILENFPLMNLRRLYAALLKHPLHCWGCHRNTNELGICLYFVFVAVDVGLIPKAGPEEVSHDGDSTEGVQEVKDHQTAPISTVS